jgi:hypothetical protein
MQNMSFSIPGCAMLVGLDPSAFGWDLEGALASTRLPSPNDRAKALAALNAEYGPKGLNVTFQTRFQGSTTVIGCASRRMVRVYKMLGLGTPPIGGSVGTMDCNIGGDSSCSESAAVITFSSPESSSEHSGFKISCLSSHDTVYVNGKKVDGPFDVELSDMDICTIGARVFAFLLPNSSISQ